MPSLAVEFPSFEPKWFLRNPHFQTLYAGFLEWFRPLPGGGEDLAFPMNDGTPDTLIGRYHAPAGNASKPLVVIVHGLPGDQNSAAVVRSYRHFHANGYPVMRLNLRGAGAQNGQTEQLYHAGRTVDIREVLGQLENDHPEKCEHGIVMMGFSFGGNMTLKLLAEHDGTGKLRAGVAVSAAIDLTATSEFMSDFDWLSRLLYEKSLLKSAKEQALETDDVRAQYADDIERAESFFEFDQYFFAEFSGFADVPDYYDSSSAVSGLSAIALPTLAIFAPNDPVAPIAPFLDVSWPTNPDFRALLTARGGHVGFHARGLSHAWHDECARRFFDAVIAASPPP